MKKLIAVIALVSSMGVAYAAEPVALTDNQMDNVSAGGTAWSYAWADAVGHVSATSQTITTTSVIGLVSVPTQGGHLLIDTGFAGSYSFASAL